MKSGGAKLLSYTYSGLYTRQILALSTLSVPEKKAQKYLVSFLFFQKNNIVLIMTVTINPFLYFHHLCNNTVKKTVKECYSAEGWL